MVERGTHEVRAIVIPDTKREKLKKILEQVGLGSTVHTDGSRFQKALAKVGEKRLTRAKVIGMDLKKAA